MIWPRNLAVNRQKEIDSPKLTSVLLTQYQTKQNALVDCLASVTPFVSRIDMPLVFHKSLFAYHSAVFTLLWSVLMFHCNPRHAIQ